MAQNVGTYFKTKCWVLEGPQVKQTSWLGHHAANFWQKCFFSARDISGKAISFSSNHTSYTFFMIHDKHGTSRWIMKRHVLHEEKRVRSCNVCSRVYPCVSCHVKKIADPILIAVHVISFLYSWTLILKCNGSCTKKGQNKVEIA